MTGREYGRRVLSRLSGGLLGRPLRVRLYSELLAANAYATVPRRSTRRAGSALSVQPFEEAE